MPLEIRLGDLASRAARQESTDGGVRRFASSALTEDEDGEGGGFWSAIARFGGFLVGGLFNLIRQATSFSFTDIWGLIVSTAQFISNFNFNVTDEALNAQIQTDLQQLAGAAGTALGSAAGYLACGVLPGSVIFSFNEALGTHVLNEVGEEALQEMSGHVASLVRQSFQVASRAAFAFMYRKVRKKFFGAPDPNAKPWSFALAVEERIEAIDNEALKNFMQEFIEEASDACIEAGYVVAGGMDAFLAEQRIVREPDPLGPQRTIEITLDRSLDEPPTTP